MAMRSIILFAIVSYTAAAALQDDSGLCKIMSCGKGKCNHTLSDGLLRISVPRCDCDAGWTQPLIGFYIPFLPCVIPNCSFDATCSEATPSTATLPSNSSDLLNPCLFPLCGEGSCQKTSDYGYACNCEQGYENLLNMTAGPCIKACSIGADCSSLGISMGSTQTPTPTPSRADRSNNLNQAAGKETISCRIATAILSLSFLFLFRC